LKTAYCMLHMTHCGVIKFSDELLGRIEELKTVVAESSRMLKAGVSWHEHVEVMITYGGMKWAEGADGVSRSEPSANGPVLAYAHYNYPNMRCVDEDVRILVGSDDACVESDHEEGSENPLGWTRRGTDGYTRDHTLGSIPEVHFSEDFLRAWCEHLGKHHLRFHREVVHVVEDMPPDHKVLLDKATATYLDEHNASLMEDKEMERSILRESCDRHVNDVRMKLPAGEKLRIGLDFHGVIDDDKNYFSNLSKRILNDGGEVHILTGSQDTPELRDKISRLGVVCTHFFSISSHHKAAGTHMWEDDHGPWMDAGVWDKSKAEYCREHGIHVHIDDSPVYGKHFGPGTVYVKYPEMTTDVHNT
jgi:hypothetical protein